MTSGDQETGGGIWVTRFINSLDEMLPTGPVLSGLLTVGLVPLFITAVFFGLIGAEATADVLLEQLLAATVTVIGPVFVWHYDERIFPTFAEQTTSVVADDAQLYAIVEKYERFFSQRSWLTTLPWAVVVLAVLVANLGFFRSLGVAGYGDPAFLTYVLFGVWWAVVTGIGLHGAITTILCIREVGQLELDIDPLHPDELGGLSNIGYFAIRTTMMNSIGSLTLPLAFTIAAEGGFEQVVYLAVFIYIGFILLSFVYPTFYVNRRAQEVREGVLEAKRQEIRELQRQMTSNGERSSTGLGDVELQLQIQTLRDDFDDYSSVNLYPLSVSILSRLASSLLFPIGFMLLEAYVFNA